MRKRALYQVVVGAVAMGIVSIAIGLWHTGVRAQTSDLTIVAAGDSLVDGFCTSSDGDFVSRLSEWTDIPIINEGVIGDETEDVLARLDSDVLSHNPDIVILLVGGNDILDGDSLASIIANLREIITELQAEGIEVLFLGAHGEFFTRGFEDAYNDLADELDVRIVNNVLMDILGRPSLLCDPVHPNDAGHEIIAEETFEELQALINEKFPNAALSGSCRPLLEDIMTGDSVRWQAYAVGGGGSYEYEWDGDDDLSGSGESVTKRYTSEGVKDAEVIVEAEDDAATFQCFPSVEVMNEPLVAECTVSDEEIFVNNTVRYRVSVDGGSGRYFYEWMGSEDTEGENATLRKTFLEERTKQVLVEVTSDPDGESVLAECPDVDVLEPRLVGKCSVEMVLNMRTEEATITWNVEVSGGDGEYDFDWNTNFSNDTDDDPSDTRIIERFALTDDGTKEAEVVVDSGGQTIILSCAAEIPDVIDLDENDRSTTSCEPRNSSFVTGRNTNWSSGISNSANEDAEFSWTGSDGLTGDDEDITVVYENPGLKTGRVEIEADSYDTVLSCQIVIGDPDEVDTGSGGAGGGCFIATAAFGTILADEVNILRDFRDEYLLTNKLGSAFVTLYYTYSPAIADVIAESAFLRFVVRQMLHPVIFVADLFV